jgi:cation:H+ antiporter
MALWILVVGVLAGLLLLTVAADQFVAGAARIATRLKVAPVVIGAVVIGFGTSAPEMVVSGIAAAEGSLDIAVGNIVGSNVANLSLVLGTAALLATIGVDASVLRREAPLSLGAVLVFAVLVQGGLTGLEGIILLVLLVAVLGWLLWKSFGDDDGGPGLSSEAELEELVSDPASIQLGREAVRTVLGLVGTLVAAQVLVGSAVEIAARIGLAEGFVGVTIVAIGTSLPELATSISGVRKGETDLIVGNLLGSNIFNSLAVGAVAGIVGPGIVQDTRLTSIGVGLMVVVAIGTTIAMATKREIVRWEGIVLLVLYLGTLPLLA